MQLSHALNPRRVSRSLVTVLLLTFIQTIVAPLTLPNEIASKAEAAPVSTSYNYTSYTSGTTFTVPTGVTSINLQVRGGAGGTGGDDGSTGGFGSSVVGYVSAQFVVAPGDVIQIFPGNVGTDGADGVRNTGGGAGGATTVAASPLNIDGTFYPNLSLAGGAGGKSGDSGSSGGGGGGGGASVVAINYKIVLIAGGGGGGGGAGNGSNNGPVAYSGNSYTSAGTNTGAAGANPGSSDGGGGGGGGGGWYGGAGGAVQYRTSEYAGVGGSYGGNYVDASGTASLNSTANPEGVGNINITYSPDELNVCTTDVQTNDIYTIVKVTQVDLCTWSVPSTVSVIDFFLVGGGGGGGGDSGGGGGGGAALSRTAIAVTPNSSVQLRVGFGGMGGSWGGKFNPITGASTAITLASGTVFSAVGGTAATTVFGAAGGAGGVASNGGFSGGAGGTGASSAGIGGAGKAGISNYFYGVQNTYGGGGGGGALTNSTTQTPAAGSNGGGAGGYASSSSVNQPGSNGADNRGGGGGGGVATGSGQKLHAGKGGSGVILIRYATNSLDEFPVSLIPDIQQRWLPSDLQILDSTREGFIDSSGNFASARDINGTIITDTATSGNGSSKSFLQLKGDTNAYFNLENLPTANNYTIFHIAKYQANSLGRIVTSSDQQWISGFWAGNTGIAFHSNWLTDAGYGRNDVWALSADQLNAYRFNGTVRANRNDSTMSVGNTLGINNSRGETSNWQLGEVLVFNRELTITEIALVEKYLSRVYGIALSTPDTSNETDTAASFAGSTFVWAKGSSRLNLSDTFTIEAWVKPTSTCNDAHICYIYSQETSIIWGIQYGTLYYGLYGTNTAWDWITTGIKVKSGEWHHVAISKELAANRSQSVKMYLDGNLHFTKEGSPYTASTSAPTVLDTNIMYQSNNRVHIGYRDNGWYFYGNIDEVKLWRGYRTADEIRNDMYSNGPIDSSNLRLYLDFNKSVSSSATEVVNRATKGDPAFAMLAYGTVVYSDVKEVSSSTIYTTISFPRTYITQNGGWKVPAGISQVQAVLVGGGGGGGGGYEGGGGGAGGFIETVTTLNSGEIYSVIVGTGGRGAMNLSAPSKGDSSTAFGLSALGGGYGTYEYYGSQGVGTSGGSGGGGGWGNERSGSLGTPGQGNAGGNSGLFDSSRSCSPTVFVGGGGGGAGTSGAEPTCTKGGNGGDGKLSEVTGTTLAAGGGGSLRKFQITGNFTTAVQGTGGSRVSGVSIGGDSAYYDNVAVGATGGATNGKYGTGSGGGAGYASDPRNSPFGAGGSGGTGVVALRYITATKPTYTKPTTAYLNAGMTETFTTNVAVDSATAGLTRTFKWESTTPTSGGVYTTLKVGTGAANAAYSWVPSDTSTTGSGYLYRLTVTDSDTAGLFITDSSTAYAVINPALNVSGTSAIVKKINIARNETFTITLGTPTYRASLSPVISGITLDTSTAGSPVLKIAETATVGTWLETITVIDSVTGRFDLALSITIAAPPSLLNTGEIVSNNLILNLDAGNSQSILLGDTTTATSAVWKDLSGNKKDASTGGASAVTYDGRTCTAPKYYSSFGGYLQFNGTSDCYHTDDIGMSIDKSFTVEAWYRSTQTLTSAGASIFTQNSAGNIGIVLGGASSVGTTDIRVGMYNGGWYNSSAGHSPVTNTWNHYVGTYDGSNFRLYVDGVLKNTTPTTAGLSSTPNKTGYFIGRRWDGSAYLAGSIASLRVYNIPLSETAVALNFNSTKYRFKDAPSSLLKPVKKYGVLAVESFTATSGYGARNFSLAASSPAGIEWDGSVTDRLTVSVQESLTVGTYYDTLTVTDALGQSSYLPITFTVTKADTLTVTMGSPLTVVYNGLVPSPAPKASISGLVGVDTATVLTRYDTATIGTTCASGGVCKIGDTGPGGGKVFYISDTIINTATGISEGGVYLEVAPLGWHTTQGQEEALAWSSVSTAVPGTLSDIGAGAENSRLVYSQLGASSAGFNVIVNKTIGGKSDWFVPSLGELEKVYENLWATGLDAFTGSRNMLSSTEDPSNTSQAMQVWNVGGIVAGVSKTIGYYMRPIRAFGGTTTPTESDSYTAQGHNLTFGVGAASNYVNVVYETSTLKITQANQEKLMINLYGAVAGAPFTLQISGGSGSGVITETVTAGSTALNCRISNRMLANDTPATEQKTCNIAITKAASRNYKSETLNATVYFMMFVNNQPTGQVGSGSTIALNGVTSFETSTTEPPTITRIDSQQVIFTVCPGGIGICTLSDVYVIRGTGFGNLFSTPVKVKFSRNKIVELGTTYQSGAWVDNDTTIVLTSLPAGISPGRIVVITPNGEGVSDFTFTP